MFTGKMTNEKNVLLKYYIYAYDYYDYSSCGIDIHVYVSQLSCVRCKVRE